MKKVLWMLSLAVLMFGLALNASALAPCDTGNDPFTGDPWVVCQVTSTNTWFSHNAYGAGGHYHADYICKMFGYSGVGRYGGTYANVCGFGEPYTTSCTNLGGIGYLLDTGDGNCGSDEYGIILCNTVCWECLGTATPTLQSIIMAVEGATPSTKAQKSSIKNALKIMKMCNSALGSGNCVRTAVLAEVVKIKLVKLWVTGVIDQSTLEGYLNMVDAVVASCGTAG